MLILDEPANGLDPPGIRWMRDLLRDQAARGRTVLVSSHLLSEVAQSVDDVVVISRGVLRASGTLEQVLGSEGGPVARFRSADDDRLAGVLQQRGIKVERDLSGALLARGTEPALVGQVAAEQQIALVELVAQSRSLEEAFFALTEVPE